MKLPRLLLDVASALRGPPVELLSLPSPDTFLGRRHHEPLPLPDTTELEMRSV
jgi:hypothetical protein